MIKIVRIIISLAFIITDCRFIWTVLVDLQLIALPIYYRFSSSYQKKITYCVDVCSRADCHLADSKLLTVTWLLTAYKLSGRGLFRWHHQWRIDFSSNKWHPRNGATWQSFQPGASDSQMSLTFRSLLIFTATRVWMTAISVHLLTVTSAVAQVSSWQSVTCDCHTPLTVLTHRMRAYHIGYYF